MKTTPAELAVFGAPPMFSSPLHVGRPNVGDRERLFQRLGEMLDRRWFTNNGPLVQELEARLAEYLGVRHAIAICNATIALELASRALDLSGEVLVPSFTFVATAHALQWQQITPVFCDVDPSTHNVDPSRIERMITPRTTGIVGVHTWGRACDIEALTDIAARHDLALMFDAAHAFGCTHKGRRIGGFGQAEVFSFHATKFFNSFEGGAITTNDDELANKIRLMRNFGFAGYDQVTYVGTNGKMSEASAAMALTSLDSIDQFITTNRANHANYRAQLNELPGIQVAAYDESERNNYQYVIVEVDETRTGLSRDELVRILHAENVLARRYFYPACHKMEPYRSYYPNAGLLLPETERLVTRVMSLPTGTAVGQSEIDGVANIIKLSIQNGSAIRERLKALS